jgi:hypothetical protein
MTRFSLPLSRIFGTVYQEQVPVPRYEAYRRQVQARTAPFLEARGGRQTKKAQRGILCLFPETLQKGLADWMSGIAIALLFPLFPRSGETRFSNALVAQ